LAGLGEASSFGSRETSEKHDVVQTYPLESQLGPWRDLRIMYLRPHRRSKDGKAQAYWSLVETVRTPDGPRHKTVCYLGELNSSRSRSSIQMPRR
jgi:hypothetical protein